MLLWAFYFPDRKPSNESSRSEVQTCTDYNSPCFLIFPSYPFQTIPLALLHFTVSRPAPTVARGHHVAFLFNSCTKDLNPSTAGVSQTNQAICTKTPRLMTGIRESHKRLSYVKIEPETLSVHSLPKASLPKGRDALRYCYPAVLIITIVYRSYNTRIFYPRIKSGIKMYITSVSNKVFITTRC